MFYLFDRRNYLRAPKAVREQLAEPSDVWKFQGTTNLFFLGVILGAVFITDPPFVREVIMFAAAFGSYWTTAKSIHEANHFNFEPIWEVAILFVGIFATMMPALDWLQAHASDLGRPGPSFFYWATGTLSSCLDNAPTYLSFVSTGLGAFVDPEVAAQTLAHIQTHGADLSALTGEHAPKIQAALAALAAHNPAHLAARTPSFDEVQIAMLLADPLATRSLIAISIGAVFFGAATYIGNGPNFMIKTIADQKRIRTPTFLGYVFKYSVPFLLPMLALVWLLFFRSAG
jgi:Na+/H+ antiporter NhaD/arsenite permease-like protein